MGVEDQSRVVVDLPVERQRSVLMVLDLSRDDGH
jgi:hypothetical protein